MWPTPEEKFFRNRSGQYGNQGLLILGSHKFMRIFNSNVYICVPFLIHRMVVFIGRIFNHWSSRYTRRSLKMKRFWANLADFQLCIKFCLFLIHRMVIFRVGISGQSSCQYESSETNKFWAHKFTKCSA